MTKHASGIYSMIHNIFAFMLNAGRLNGGKATRMTITNTSENLNQSVVTMSRATYFYSAGQHWTR